MITKSKIIKFISFFLIIAVIAPTILLSRPKPIQAFWGATWLTDIFTGVTVGTTGTTAGATVTTASLGIKDVAKEILKQIVMSIQRRLLATMTKSMVNWINSGFHGAPLFLENPQSFFKDIAKYEIKTLINSTGYDSKRFPFGQKLALDTIASYKRQFENNAEYSLSNVINDPALLDRYRNDFNVGGWNGFLINTQYPQNNYLGYKMLYTEELARRLEGTITNKANKVKDVIQQGMGFLSPQTCPSNPLYNNAKNEFQQPSFNNSEYTRLHPFDLPDPIFYSNSETGGTTTDPNDIYRGIETPESIDAREEATQRWQVAQIAAKAAWAKTNTCPGGLVNTTPGYVVANQITNAMGSNFRQTELGAALGNSMSAIFDALLNKFLGDGLNALASKVNPKPTVDDWTYEGQTLGSPTDGTNVPWDAGPDEEIILDTFKKQISGKTIIDFTGTDLSGADLNNTGINITEEVGDTGNGTYILGDIANTQKELTLMYNVDTTNPGIIQILGEIWPKSRELDICQPGPDIGWKDRLLTEVNRNSKKLQEKTNDNDGEKAAQADLVLKELKFAVSFFKDWINNQMMSDLPNSVLYMDAVDEMETLSQQSDELTDRRRIRTQALARLRAIETALTTFTVQPSSGSPDEKRLISLRKQYNAIKFSIANTATIDDMQNELAIAKEKLANLKTLATQCNGERTIRGWSVPGGPTSIIGGVTEKEIYCDAPINGGYNHEMFTHNNDSNRGTFGTIIGGIAGFGIGAIIGNQIGGSISSGSDSAITHLEIPYVNAQKVYTWRSLLGLKGHKVDIQLSCNIIWKANILDYKGNLPGTTQIPEPYVELPDDIGNNSGICVVNGSSQPLGENDCNANGGTWTTEQTGTCTISAGSESGVTQGDCNANGGTWTP
ncbi:hypothetical protein A3G98_02575 [Candidatus Nomurabacteria bacterium RIFCSPLOWO2_12_FULL_37_8]|uniref:Uncharacterized protein n=1 Tax=Candidatus Nomurabacteria bacterium RIFCSPLOWO2_12_FULL_37_8 TaxID=1801793 RepID=A0A1F6Y414_9BACT|nr:MAG: hypothetical protein A3G98_02575 [Candidatus Nomurabacteria bacterium RIFCSPLOWO2_12_FULL_37_8]